VDDTTDIGTASSLPVHVEIPGYRLRHLSDSDSIGFLFSAEQTSLGRKVTLKILKPKYEDHPRAREEFLAEMDRLAGLDHPNLPRVLDMHREGLLVLVTERVGVHPLQAALEDGKPLAEGRAVSLALGVARALRYLASEGFAHKNVSPRTVITRPDGCRLLTFRNVIPLSEQAALKGRLVQDPRYVAPEQLAGPHAVGPNTPCYVVAGLLFHMLTANPPHEGASAKETAVAHLKQPFPSPRRYQPFLAKAYQDVIAACTQLDPDARPSLDELVEALEALADGRDPGLAPPKPSGPVAPKPRRRRRRRR